MSSDTALQFPSQAQLFSCLDQHPILEDARFLKEAGVLSDTASFFAHEVTNRIDKGVMHTLMFSNDTLKLDPRHLQFVHEAMVAAVKDCAVAGGPGPVSVGTLHHSQVLERLGVRLVEEDHQTLWERTKAAVEDILTPRDPEDYSDL